MLTDLQLPELRVWNGEGEQKLVRFFPNGSADSFALAEDDTGVRLVTGATGQQVVVGSFEEAKGLVYAMR